MAIPSLFKLSHDDRQTSVDHLVEGASPNAEFYLLLVLSTIITTFGVVQNSATIVIGGMLVAPILSPILSIAMSIVMADFKLLFQSIKVFLASMGLILVIALLISLVSLQVEINSEVAARSEASLVFFLVALAAGIAAAFAYARPSLSVTVPGIAVTVAILPPLVVVPIALTMANMEILVGSLGLFFLNVLGIIFAATIVFSLMGFYRQRTQAVQQLEKEIAQKNNHK